MPFICVFEDIYFDESNFSLQWIFNFEMMTEVDFSPQWNLLFLSFFFVLFLMHGIPAVLWHSAVW